MFYLKSSKDIKLLYYQHSVLIDCAYSVKIPFFLVHEKFIMKLHCDIKLKISYYKRTSA